MSELPLRTRIYTVLLVLITVAASTSTWVLSRQVLDQAHLITAAILLIMILAAEVLDVSFPHSVIPFHISVSAAFCFAAGLTVGPVVGCIVVALAHFLDGLYVRREMIKIVVNSAGLGLSTLASGLVYLEFSNSAQTTLGSPQNLITATVAATVYTLVNTVTLALIVSPIMGMGAFQMWSSNFSGLFVELLTLAPLGSLIPVLVSENPLAIVLLIVPLLIGPHLAFKGIQQAQHETRITMEGLADALERRDPYTYRHSIRVTEYARIMLNTMPHIPQPTREAILAAARVHDLGKVGAQDGSLKKPGELTNAQRAEIQQHAAVGAEIVGRLDAYKPSVDVVRHHHERWDGSGYPDGLEGERIPLGSRIIAVADAFDAMTSDRVYRPALSPEAALVELQKGRGSQFDPQIVDLFQAALEARPNEQRSQEATETLERSKFPGPPSTPPPPVVARRGVPRFLPRRFKVS